MRALAEHCFRVRLTISDGCGAELARSRGCRFEAWDEIVESCAKALRGAKGELEHSGVSGQEARFAALGFADVTNEGMGVIRAGMPKRAGD